MLNQDDVFFLMIDMQDKLIEATLAHGAVICAKNLVSASAVLNIPLVVTEQYPKGLGQSAENIAKEFRDNVKMFEKTGFSVLFEENIKNHIKSLNKKQVVIFGIELHICVLQSALALLNEGFEVFVVSDASKSRHAKDFNEGLNYLRQMGAYIITTEIALFEILKTSRHPKFRQIQALIK